MKTLSRRSVTTGLAAAVMAVPAVGLSVSIKSNARARIEHHTRELERAMRDCYRVEVTVKKWEATPEGMRPLIFFVANT